MIFLQTRGKKFVVELYNKSHPDYTKVYIIVRSLLSVYELSHNKWVIGYDDLIILGEKLNALGLTDGRYLDQAAQDLLSECQAHAVRNKNIKAGLHNDLIKKGLEGKLKLTPYPDQWTGIAFLVENYRVGLFDSMGIGKTAQSLGSIAYLSSEVRRTLVIAPKSVLIGFANEIVKHTYLKSITLPSGRKAALEFLKDNKNSDWDLLLVNPENLINSGKSKGKGLSDPYGEITKVLKTIPFDMVIVDEYHQYKNMDAKRTQCVMSLLREIRNKDGNFCRAILMTGTPISESPVNAYAVLKVLGTDRLPHVTRFEDYFTIKKPQTFTVKAKGKSPKRVTVDKVVGYKNLDELKQRIEAVSIRRTKEDMKGFPDQVFITRNVLLAGKQKALYKAVCGEIIAGLPKSSQISLEKFFSGAGTSVKLRQLMNHPQFIEEDCESAKYKEIDDILEELFADPDQKVIIWTEYRKAVDLIHERWNEQYGVIKLYGGVDITDKMVEGFEGKGGPRIVAAIPAKAGTGVDFLARARTAIYIDRPYSYTLYKQSIDRIHRRVKTEGELSWLDKIKSQVATIIFLDIANSIDEIVRQKLESKQDVADAVMTSNEKLEKMGRVDLLKYLR